MKELIAKDLRARRAAAGISGQSVRDGLGPNGTMSRGKFSAIERGYCAATPAKLQRISDAIDKIIIDTRNHLSRFAAEGGLSLAGLRF